MQYTNDGAVEHFRMSRETGEVRKLRWGALHSSSISSVGLKRVHQRHRRGISRRGVLVGGRAHLKLSVCAVVALLPFVMWFGICSTPELVIRFLPRAQRELRRKFGLNWSKRMNELRQKKTYSFDPNLGVKVRVIALSRAWDRRKRITKTLTSNGVIFELFDAVDGLNMFDDTVVRLYAGLKRQQRLRPTMHFEKEKMVTLFDDFKASKLRSRTLQSSLHERLRFGCYMSHVSLWIEVMRDNLPFAIVLEDDVDVAMNFQTRVIEQLISLPENWGLLYLNGCFRKLGPVWSPGLRVSRGGLCTHGYVISRAGMAVFLRRAVLNNDSPIDHVMDEEVLSGRVLAFHSDPPLVRVLSSVESTLAYPKRV